MFPHGQMTWLPARILLPAPSKQVPISCNSCAVVAISVRFLLIRTHPMVYQLLRTLSPNSHGSWGLGVFARDSFVLTTSTYRTNEDDPHDNLLTNPAGRIPDPDRNEPCHRHWTHHPGQLPTVGSVRRPAARPP